MPNNEFQSLRDSHNSTSSAESGITFADVFAQPSKTVSRLARETSMITTGTVSGAIEEFNRDPVSTFAKAGSTVAIGAGLGVLAASEAPVLVAGAAATGLALTGMWVYDTFNPNLSRNNERFRNIGTALNDVWHHSDKQTYDASVKRMADGAGPIALDVGLMALGGAGAHLAARHAPKLSPQLNFLEPAPAAVANFFDARSSNLLFDFNDLAFFQRKNGPVRVDKGSPDSLPARIEMLNARAGFNNSNKPEPRSVMGLVDKPSPLEHRIKGYRPTYFRERFSSF